MALGVMFNGMYDANEFIAFAKEAEVLGIGSAWIAEQPGHRDAFVVATALARQTGLRVCPGAISPYSRHPMTIAMSAAALNELAPGRVGLVVGTGGVPSQAAYGVRVEQPARTMREAVESIRALLAGDTLDRQGARFVFENAKLVVSAPDLPIYLAAIGPKMQAAAGTAADGIVFSSGHSTTFLVKSRQQVLAAHAQSERAAAPFASVGFIVAAVAADRAAAVDRTKALLSYLFSSPHKSEDWELNGVTVDYAAIAQSIQRHDWETAKHYIDDHLVALHSAAGSPREYQERIQAYLEVGLDVLVLAPLGTLEEKKLAVQLALEVAEGFSRQPG